MTGRGRGTEDPLISSTRLGELRWRDGIKVEIVAGIAAVVGAGILIESVRRFL